MRRLMCLALAVASCRPALGAAAGAPIVDGAVRLTVVPGRVFKETFGDPPGPQDRWVAYLVVADAKKRALAPRKATIELFSRGRLVETIRLEAAALAASRAITFRVDESAPGPQIVHHFVAMDELFDLRQEIEVPAALRVDRMVYRLTLALPGGDAVEKTLDLPVTEYTPRTKLISPLAGDFLVVCGHVGEGCHDERSQHFAVDLLPVGKLGEVLAKEDGTHDQDYFGWGREIVAPAAGVIVHARNDIPDQTTPQHPDPGTFIHLDEPAWAAMGNGVVIDHGDGEFSLLAHMQKGSVRVKAGDRVKQGDVLGLLGASGNVTGPHLHYQLMAGPEIFRSDPLPSRFENTAPPVPRAGHFAGTR